MRLHKNSIKEKTISSFISEEKRAPTQQEIKALYNEYLLNNPNALDHGLSSSKTNKYIVPGEESSVSKINDLTSNLDLDSKELLNKVNSERENLENIFRNYFQRQDRVLKEVKRLERDINKNLLLYSKEDIFTYGVVESFEDYSKVDFGNSNINFFNGKATLGFSSLKGEEESIKNISYTFRSKGNSFSGEQIFGSITNTKYQDGSFFKAIGFSSLEDDLIQFIITLNFSNEKTNYIDTIKFITSAIERNSKMGFQCYYTLDMVKYIEVFESNLRITENQNLIEINKNDVKEIKIVFSKSKADYIDGNNFAYVFSLDYISILEKDFDIDAESVLFLGPYEISDENNKPINFSMATLKGGTCCLVPDKTSINFYLSKDNSTWFPCGYDNRSKQIVQFEEMESSMDDNLFEIVDPNTSYIHIAETIPSNISLKNNESLLNYKIAASKKDFLIRKSLKIQRNKLVKGNQKLYNAYAGWFKDEQDYYNTVIQIEQPEGRYINFGNRSCYLNNREVSGKIFIPYGTHDFKTHKSNYFVINDDENEIKNAAQLKRIDSLYPYNHKYLIEGFLFNKDFIGKKLYNGVDKVFSFDLKEISNQRFNSTSDLNVFTIIENDDGLFFKIKNHEGSGEIKLEQFNINCKRINENSNQGSSIFIKAVIKSFDKRVTPKIDQIQVRVI